VREAQKPDSSQHSRPFSERCHCLTLVPLPCHSALPRTTEALQRVDALCVSMQHLLSRLREAEAWQVIVQHSEQLLGGAQEALERLQRVKAEVRGAGIRRGPADEGMHLG
jgi:hypothetical protein